MTGDFEPARPAPHLPADALPDPEPAVPSLPAPDPGVFHPDPASHPIPTETSTP